MSLSTVLLSAAAPTATASLSSCIGGSAARMAQGGMAHRLMPRVRTYSTTGPTNAGPNSTANPNFTSAEQPNMNAGQAFNGNPNKHSHEYTHYIRFGPKHGEQNPQSSWRNWWYDMRCGYGPRAPPQWGAPAQGTGTAAAGGAAAEGAAAEGSQWRNVNFASGYQWGSHNYNPNWESYNRGWDFPNSRKVFWKGALIGGAVTWVAFGRHGCHHHHSR